MAVTLVGLRSAKKTTGEAPTASRVYVVSSTAQITTDIDSIIDATGIPAYNSAWDAGDNTQLLVNNKSANALDELNGYHWEVMVNYVTPTGNPDQRPLDPRERPWDWSKNTDQYEQVIAASMFDTAGYDYPPAADPPDIVNLGSGVAITNTAGQPPEGGVVTLIPNSVFTMTKYVDKDGYDDIVTGATSWYDVDKYIGTVNDAAKTMLGHAYAKWELLCEDISYRPYSENGYDVMEVNITVRADTYKKHIFTFVSAGYKEISAVTDELVPILDAHNMAATEPSLLDLAGSKVPEPVAAPYTKDPTVVSVGVNEEKSFTNLLIPSTIP